MPHHIIYEYPVIIFLNNLLFLFYQATLKPYKQDHQFYFHLYLSQVWRKKFPVPDAARL